jgi:chromate transporter
MLKIGAIGFGGGTALIPVIENEVVEKEKLVDEKDYNKYVAVASITPGALPVEIATGIGQKIGGNRGMIAAATAMALPGAFLTLFFLLLFSGISDEMRVQIGFISAAVSVLIIFMLFKYVLGTLKQSRNRKEQLLYLFLMVGIFLLSFFFSSTQILLSAFGVILVILACAEHFYPTPKNKKKKGFPLKKLSRSLVCWILFTVVLSLPALLISLDTVFFLLRGFVSSIMSFGGGDAYLSVAQGIFVDSHLISHSDFYGNVVTVANALPGSILCKVLTGIGYTIGYGLHQSVLEGILMALSGFACSISASGMIVIIVTALYEKYEDLQAFASIQRFIRPVISGLLLKVAYTLYLSGIRQPFMAGRPTLPTVCVGLVFVVAIFYMLQKNQKGKS